MAGKAARGGAHPKGARGPKAGAVGPGFGAPRPVTQPQFAEAQATPDPAKFLVRHPSDTPAYKILDKTPHLPPLPFDAPRMQPGKKEPIMLLADALGSNGAAIVDRIKGNTQIVFHSVGDTGNTRSTHPQSLVADKMVSDFDELDAKDVPAFYYHLGDVVYSFGESAYYYDQFYDAYRDYPAPIFAIPGNHDGMVSPLTPNAVSLSAFYDNFCSPTLRITKEAGGLPRTAMQQPGVFFTLEAPFVRILGLYSNRLESPGVIAAPAIGISQLDFLDEALSRAARDLRGAALIIAVHHPAYSSGGKHPGSPDMLKQIDAACEKAGIWPHAVLSGHAHNYQRFTRIRNAGAANETNIPYVTCGNGGHNVTRLTHANSPALRTPLRETAQEQNGSEQVILENYDDVNYGYLRLIVDSQQLRIEYHPQADGSAAKTPDDFVTVDLATRKLVHFRPTAQSTAEIPHIQTRGHSVVHNRPRPARAPKTSSSGREAPLSRKRTSSCSRRTASA